MTTPPSELFLDAEQDTLLKTLAITHAMKQQVALRCLGDSTWAIALARILVTLAILSAFPLRGSTPK